MNNRLTVWIDDEEVAVPALWEVCSRCDGDGAVALPGQAFTSEEMREMGGEFLEDYLSGRYDEPCPKCHGRTTVLVVDEDRCPADVLAAYEQEQRWECEYRGEREAERRMGC